jgi:hypothetical protein
MLSKYMLRLEIVLTDSKEMRKGSCWRGGEEEEGVKKSPLEN